MCAVDVSGRMIARARERLAGLPNVRLREVGNSEFLSSFEAERFDLVFSFLVLQHIAREDAFLYLRDAFRVLRRGGTLLTQFPNLLSPRTRARSSTRRRSRRAAPAASGSTRSRRSATCSACSATRSSSSGTAATASPRRSTSRRKGILGRPPAARVEILDGRLRAGPTAAESQTCPNPISIRDTNGPAEGRARASC
jgi:SAM-dependent methyltransferase